MGPKLSQADYVLTKNIPGFLKARVLGQDHAIDAMVPSLYAYRANINPKSRPAGIYLLLGPTGVGKTETASALAELIHADKKRVLHINCAEYSQPHEVAKLVGAPPGYLGHRETDPLFSTANLKNYTSGQSSLKIILFDEIEKAHHALFNFLLGIFDKGRMTTGVGGLVDFEDTLILMTSNLGASDMMDRMDSARMGFASPGNKGNATLEAMDTIGQRAAKKLFRPEFINRLDAIITYKPLDKKDIQKIAVLVTGMLQKEIASRTENKVILHFEDTALALLVKNGYSIQYGVRNLNRLLNTEIRNKVALWRAEQTTTAHQTVIHVTSHYGKFKLTPEPVTDPMDVLRYC